MLPIDFIPNLAPPRTLELVRQPAPAVAREIQLSAHCLPASLEAALQAFFNQRAQRGALSPGYTPSLLYQLVRELYCGLHMGDPYPEYGNTVLVAPVNGKSGVRAPVM